MTISAGWTPVGGGVAVAPAAARAPVRTTTHCPTRTACAVVATVCVKVVAADHVTAVWVWLPCTCRVLPSMAARRPVTPGRPGPRPPSALPPCPPLPPCPVPPGCPACAPVVAEGVDAAGLPVPVPQAPTSATTAVTAASVAPVVAGPRRARAVRGCRPSSGRVLGSDVRGPWCCSLSLVRSSGHSLRRASIGASRAARPAG